MPAVHRSGQPGHTARQGHQAAELGRPHDLVGDEDVRDPCVGHDLRFAHLRGGDAHGAGAELEVGNLRRLVGLDVRPQLQSGLRGCGLQAREVLTQDRAPHEQRRRVEVLERLPDKGCVR